MEALCRLSLLPSATKGFRVGFDAGGGPLVEVGFGIRPAFEAVDGEHLLLEEVARVEVGVRLLQLLYAPFAPVVEVRVRLEYEEPAFLQVELRLPALPRVFASPQLVKRVAGVFEHVELCGI